jgi:hypothetical protein
LPLNFRAMDHKTSLRTLYNVHITKADHRIKR